MNDLRGNEMGVSNEFTYQFLTAGNCGCTLVDNYTNVNFTYRIIKAKNTANTYWIKVMTAPYTFTFGGTLRISLDGFRYTQGNKGKVGFNAPSIQLLMRVLAQSKKGKLQDNFEVLHLGTCGRCKRPLTDPESLKTGLGPICRKKV